MTGQRTPCVTDPDAWWSTDHTTRLEAAEACFHCPIRRQCHDDAVARGERSGVWGGKLFDGVTPSGPPATCKRGHPKTAENRRADGKGCKACKREVGREKRRRIQEAGVRKLTLEDARVIRRRGTCEGVAVSLLASEFRVTPQTVQRILAGKTFREDAA